MLRLFARRQRASMSAYFTNALTPPTGLGLLASLAAGLFRSGSAWLGRSQKDGLPTCREGPCGKKVQGHQLAHREGQPRRCPFLIGIGNGCQVRATLLCSLPYRSPAQASPLMDHAVFGSVFLRCSWDLQRSPRGTGADSRYAKRKKPRSPGGDGAEGSDALVRHINSHRGEDRLHSRFQDDRSQ
jgi:hypothetical protein